MVDVDGIARDAGRGLMDSASEVDLPDINSVGASRRRRSGAAAAAGAFVATIVVIGAATLGGETNPGGLDAAIAPTTDVAARQTTTVVETIPPVLLIGSADGIEMAWPFGWDQAEENLTAAHLDPLELISVATFPLASEAGVCGPFPWQAVVEFPADGALLTLRERFRNVDTSQYPTRPNAFGPEAPPYVLPEGDCLDNTSRGDIGVMRWFEFTDQGRYLQLLVVVGTEVSDRFSTDVWDIANSLIVQSTDGVATLTSKTVYGGNAFVLDRGTGPEVCGAIATSLPPQCGGPRLIGLDWADVSWADEAQGVTWADMYIEFTIVNSEFHLMSGPTERRSVDVPEPAFPPPPVTLDVQAVFDDIKSLKVTDWPAGLVGIFGFGPNETDDYVTLDALLVTEDGQRWLDDRYGVGAVRATGSFHPVGEIETTEVPPPMPQAPSLPGEPDTVRARDTLYYCGAYVEGLLTTIPAEIGLTIDESAAGCFQDRLSEGHSTEVIVVRSTIEGDPIVYIYRRLVDSKFEVFVDSTRDASGVRQWTTYTCLQMTFDPLIPEGCEAPLRVEG